MSLTNAVKNSNVQENARGIDSWAISLSFLLMILFGLGWWIGNFVKDSVQDRRKKILFISFITILFIFDIVLFTAIFPSGFWHYALGASNLIFGSGLFFRLSVLR